VLPVGFPDESDPLQRSIPALDPAPEGPDAQYLAQNQAMYQAQATERRRELAEHYLGQWNWNHNNLYDLVNYNVAPFERETLDTGGKVAGKMSQFLPLWRIFTCGQLERLLSVEYPTTNLPHMLRQSQSPVQQALEEDYMFVGVVYWAQKRQLMPGMFKSPIQGSAMAFSQVFVFLPRPRYETGGGCPTWYGPTYNNWTGTSGCDTPYLDRWPTEWSLFNQNWTAKPVPATAESLAAILQTPPISAPNIQLPNLGGMSTSDIRLINTH
jgi:hypothetical protein